MVSSSQKVRTMFNNVVRYKQTLEECYREVNKLATATFYCATTQQAIDEVMVWNVKIYKIKTFLRTFADTLAELTNDERDRLVYWSKSTIEEYRQRYQPERSTRSTFRDLNKLSTHFLRIYNNNVLVM